MAASIVLALLTATFLSNGRIASHGIDSERQVRIDFLF